LHRQRPEATPDTMSRSFGQNHPLIAFGKEQMPNLLLHLLGAATYWTLKDGLAQQRQATGTPGAIDAAGLAGQTEGGSQLHNRLGVIAWSLHRGSGLRLTPQQVEPTPSVGRKIEIKLPGQYPAHVSVENWGRQSEGDGGNGARRRTPHSGERRKCCHRVWERTAPGADDLPSRPVEQSRSAVIPQTRPLVQNRILVGCGQGIHDGKPGHKTGKSIQDRGNLGLLQHDF